MVYNILVRETLERIVPVEAETSTEAIRIVQDLYDKEEIVLDYRDFTGYDITEEEP